MIVPTYTYGVILSSVKKLGMAVTQDADAKRLAPWIIQGEKLLSKSKVRFWALWIVSFIIFPKINGLNPITNNAPGVE